MSSIPPPPRTRGRQVTPGVNDLATTHAEVAAQWHETLNSDLWPQHVSAGSARKVWWQCSLGHAWQAGIGYRVRHGYGCPYCSNRFTLAGFNDLATRNPELAAQWHPTKNGDLTPQMMTDKSHRKVWWGCVDGHAWEAQIKSRASGGHGCPYCFGRSAVEGVNDLATTQVEIANQWHPTKNGDLRPNQVKAKANIKTWWRCDVGHEWQARVADRTEGQGCPACSGRAVVPGFNDLATTNGPLAAQWHPTKNGNLTPQNVTMRSNKTVWWQCSGGHVWQAVIYARTSGNGCPVCTNKAVLAGVNDLATTHAEIADQWHPAKNGALTPRDLVAGSDRKVWWFCRVNPDHPDWEAGVHSRAVGKGCARCAREASRGEEEIAEIITALLEGTSQTVERNDRKVLGGKEIDVLIPGRLGIEFNGTYWHSEPYRTTHDHAAKAKAVRSAGLQFVAIWDDEWTNRRDIVIRALAHRLGATDRLPALLPHAPAYWFERVGARSLTPRILTKSTADEFLNTHHVQGATAMLTTYGLVDALGRTRAVLSVRVRSGQAEIVRYATAGIVPGGFTRLLKHAEQLLPDNVGQWVTFADHAISDGGLYESNGFTAEKVLRPDYSYAGNRTRWVREHKFNYRLKRFQEDPVLTYVDGATERELAAINGLVRVWDYGKTRYVKAARSTS